jgi:hypothetical protein
MKKNTSIFLISIVFSILLFTLGCKDEDTLTHVTDFENKIHKAVNTYRATKTLQAITLQFLMVDDAQNNSRKIANGTAPYSVNPTDEVMVNLNTLKVNLGGDTCAAVVQFSESENADTIVNRIKRDRLKREVIEGNFNQIGVGSAKQSATGKWYVTLLLIHIP